MIVFGGESKVRSLVFLKNKITKTLEHKLDF